MEVGFLTRLHIYVLTLSIAYGKDPEGTKYGFESDVRRQSVYLLLNPFLMHCSAYSSPLGTKLAITPFKLY